MSFKKVEAALRVAGMGFRVFPLKANSKLPAIKGWPELATTDHDRISALWAEYPESNIGVATGGDTLVIDVDVKDGKGGEASLARLTEEYGLPSGKRVRTPTGGLHIYLKKPAAVAIGNSANTLMPGIDIRAERGFVVAEGSTIDGVEYKAVGGTLDSCPDDLLQKLARGYRAQKTNDIGTTLDKQHNIDAAEHWLQTKARLALEGDAGDHTTFSVAAELRARGVSEAVALDLMLNHWNDRCCPPWDAQSLALKVANAFQYGQGAPGYKTIEADFGEFDEIDLGTPPSLERIVAAQAAPRQEPGKRVVTFKTLQEMRDAPRPQWLVEGVVQEGTSALIFGKSNTFKSFAAIDIALSVASGRPWHGHEAQQGKVLYVATEGAFGVGQQRLPGWLNYHDVPQEIGDTHVYMLTEDMLLDVAEDANALIEAINTIGGIKLVVLDIFGGTTNGTETEDTTAKAWTRNVQHIIKETGSAVLTVAHTGWGDSTRARMHTHFWGSFDTRLKMERVEAEGAQTLYAELSVDRHKDADSTGKWIFHMHTHEFGEEDSTLIPLDASEEDLEELKGWGDAPTDKATRAKKDKAAAAMGDRADKAAGLIEAHFILHEDGMPKDDWYQACYAVGIVEGGSQSTKNKQMQRLRDWMVEQGRIEVNGDRVFAVDTAADDT